MGRKYLLREVQAEREYKDFVKTWGRGRRTGCPQLFRSKSTSFGYATSRLLGVLSTVPCSVRSSVH